MYLKQKLNFDSISQPNEHNESPIKDCKLVSMPRELTKCSIFML